MDADLRNREISIFCFFCFGGNFKPMWGMKSWVQPSQPNIREFAKSNQNGSHALCPCVFKKLAESYPFPISAHSAEGIKEDKKTTRTGD